MFGEMSLPLDHPPFANLQTVYYLAHPTEVSKCFKFLPLILEPWPCADDLAHAPLNFLLQ